MAWVGCVGDGRAALSIVDDSAVEEEADVCSSASPLTDICTKAAVWSVSTDDFDCSLLVEGGEDSMLEPPVCRLIGCAGSIVVRS